jgi:hypothetical protein
MRHIFTGVQTKISRIGEEDIQFEITKDNFLENSSGKASLYVPTQKASDRLTKVIHGKVHIDITALPQSTSTLGNSM